MRIRRATSCALALASTVALGACGSEEPRTNADRPPASINVTAAVIDGRIQVSPRSFGAGPVRLLVTNQTPSAQAVTIETEDVQQGPGLTQSTQPIDPAETATLEVDLREGTYAIHAAGRGIRPASVRVGAPRASAQGDLLLP